MVGLDTDLAQGGRPARRRELHRGPTPRRALAAVAQRAAGDDPLRGTCVPLRRGHHLRPPPPSTRPVLVRPHLPDHAATALVRRAPARDSSSSLESTTYPGTTRERLRPILEESGLAAGRDFHLAFSPERIHPGAHRLHGPHHPEVVGGPAPEPGTDRAAALYGEICDEIVRGLRPRARRVVPKLLENIFRSVNIALVNVLAQLRRAAEVSTSGRSWTPPRPSPSASCVRARPWHGGSLPPDRSVLPRV